MTESISEKVTRHAHLNTDATRAPELWLQSLGTQFVDVWLYCTHARTGTKTFELERLVEDHDTFLEVLEMRMSSRGADYAMWHDGEQWTLVRRSTGNTRSYPSREAAEMVAIHHG